MENNQSREMGKGIHIISNLYECKRPEYLVDKKKLEALLTKTIQENELTVLRKDFHKFVPEGVDEEENRLYGMTGYMLLAESHVSIHTWPDRENYIAMDIFVCNYSKDNRENAMKIYHSLLDSFQPTRKEEYFIPRN
jgi:S-adenosylmethionine decarboxylase proenzyme